MTYRGIDHTIYIHTNKKDGKVYIGQTNQTDLTRRWGGGHGYRRCRYFMNAINKYGWNGFTHEILETGLTEEQANEREKYYISLYQSSNPQYGYNICSGGKAKTEISPEGIQSLKERFSGANNPIAKAVRIYDCEGNFVIECQTVSAAAKYLGCHSGIVVEVCKGAKATVKSHICFYKEDVGELQKLSVEQTVKPRDMRRKFKQVNRYAINGEYINTYSSIIGAANEIGIKQNAIVLACRGKYKSAGGYMWRYYDSSTANIEPYHSDIPKGENHYTKRRLAQTNA